MRILRWIRNNLIKFCLVLLILIVFIASTIVIFSNGNNEEESESKETSQIVGTKLEQSNTNIYTTLSFEKDIVKYDLSEDLGNYYYIYFNVDVSNTDNYDSTAICARITDPNDDDVYTTEDDVIRVGAILPPTKSELKNGDTEGYVLVYLNDTGTTYLSLYSNQSR